MMPVDATTDFLKRQYQRTGRRMPMVLQSPQAFEKWHIDARAQFRALLGLNKLESCKPLPLVYEWMDVAGGYVRERAILQTEPEVWMPFFILRKKEWSGAHPAVILLPTNGAGKFGVVNSEDYEFFSQLHNQAAYAAQWAFAETLVDQGFLVLAPDVRGTGERREWMDAGEAHFDRSSRRPVNNVALSLGLSLAGIDVWEMGVLADYLLTRDDCNGKLCIGGADEAGIMALYCAAVDERFSKTFMLNGLAGFENGALTVGCLNCATYVPSLMLHFDLCDIAALVAPRALLVQSTADCPLNGADSRINVSEQAVQVQCAYALKEAMAHFHLKYHECKNPSLLNEVIHFLTEA